jgi:hypothetical protein
LEEVISQEETNGQDLEEGIGLEERDIKRSGT